MKQAIMIRGKSVTLEDIKAMPDEARIFWTPEEEEVLRQVAAMHKSVRAAAVLLGRTEHATRQKMQVMGLSRRAKQHA